MSTPLTDRLADIQSEVEAYRGSCDFDTVARMCRAPKADDRLFGILLLQREEPVGREWFDLARSMIDDGSNTIRWQAVVAVSGWLSHDEPEWVWEVIKQYGDVEDDDMRAAIATCLLEHLMEQHFDDYIGQIQALAKTTSPRFLRTMEMCWFTPEDRKSQWQTVLRRLERYYQRRYSE